MLKVRISKDGITRSYHFQDKVAEWFDADGTGKGSFEIEGELQGLAEIINANVGCNVEMIEEEKILKDETISKLMESSKLEVKFQSPLYDEVEIAMLPTVICKKDGRVANIVDVDRKIIMEIEN